MIEALTPLFCGRFHWLESWAVLASEAPKDAVATRDIFTPSGLDRIVTRHAPNYPAGDPRAVLSLWSGYYFAAVIYIPLAAHILLDWFVPAEFERTGLVLGSTGEVRQLVLPNPGHAAATTTVSDRLRALIDTSLSPAIDAMARHNGLAPRVYWDNAAQHFAYLVDTLAALPDSPASAAAEAAGIMQRETFADGRRNPFYAPRRTVTDERGLRQTKRRLCCIRFRLPGLGYCDNCPANPAQCRGQAG